MRRTSAPAGPDGFRGRTALVTGGASGIGRALAAELVSRGADVVVADLDGAAAERTAGELGAAGPGTVVARQLDVRDEAAFGAVVQQTVADLGRLDLLCNNAGISMGGPTHELTGAHWNRIIDVNIRGVVNGVLAAYPVMIDQGSGQIVNTASGAGLSPPPFVTAYAMTKHAVVGLSLAMRAEAALHGVGVSVLCPGAIDTPILDRVPEADLPATASPPVSGRAYLSMLGQKPTAAEPFARRAVDLMAANRSVIVVPSNVKVLWYLARFSPRLAEAVGGVMARRVHRRLPAPTA